MACHPSCPTESGRVPVTPAPAVADDSTGEYDGDLEEKSVASVARWVGPVISQSESLSLPALLAYCVGTVMGLNVYMA